jgi:hypothetical protein
VRIWRHRCYHYYHCSVELVGFGAVGGRPIAAAVAVADAASSEEEELESTKRPPVQCRPLLNVLVMKLGRKRNWNWNVLPRRLGDKRAREDRIVVPLLLPDR